MKEILLLLVLTVATQAHIKNAAVFAAYLLVVLMLAIRWAMKEETK